MAATPPSAALAAVPATATDPFRAIADSGRRLILDALATGECTVSQLTELLALSQPAVSQHLQVLRQAGLVQERREGRFRYYSVCAGPLRDVFDWVAPYETFWAGKLDALARHLQRKGH